MREARWGPFAAEKRVDKCAYPEKVDRFVRVVLEHNHGGDGGLPGVDLALLDERVKPLLRSCEGGTKAGGDSTRRGARIRG